MTDAPAPDRSALVVGSAVRSVFVLGLSCVLFGLTFFIAFGVLNPFERFRPYFMALALVWLVPGAVLLCCAYLMRRHTSRNAASVALGASVFQSLAAGVLLVAAMTFEPVSALPIVLCGIWLLALGDCIRQLVRARRFLASATERVRGFEVVARASSP
jgi:hypothetical protein